MKLRVIVFKRFLQLPEATEQVVYPLDTNEWIALGHFDSMCSYAIETENSIFDQIALEQKKILDGNNSDSIYVHPLYLLRENEDKTIWDAKVPFLSISRIHFSESIDVKKIREMFTSRLIQKGYVTQQNFYQSAELSDLVIVQSSDCLRSLTDFVLGLREDSCVGKAYSYFCINKNCVFTQIEHPMRNIPFVSMRLSVGSTNGLDRQLALIKEKVESQPVYSISGNDDLELVWKDLNPVGLLRLYGEWFGKGQKNIDEWPFLDVTTTLGTHYTRWVPDVLHNNELKKRCLNLRETKNAILEALGTHAYWTRQMSELVNSLVSMSNSVILDEFIYLLYPGANAFLTRLQNSHYVEEGQQEQYYTFIKKWSKLSEYIIRNEGQLNYYPEIHPRLNGVSFVFLEYIMAFLYQCEDFLKDSAIDTHEILIVPDNSKRISTQEVFAPDEKGCGLVLIDIPLHELTSAGITLRSLCHEISHFVGEESRNRANRLEYFAQTMAIDISYKIFGSCEKPLVDLLCRGGEELGFQDLFTYMKTAPQMTIDVLQHRISKWINYVFYNEQVYNQLVRAILRRQNNVRVTKLPTFNALLDNDIKLLQDAANNFGNLLREIYADMCMVSILQLDCSDYMELIARDLYGNRVEELPPGREAAFDIDCIRVFVCLSACGIELTEVFKSKYSHFAKGIYQLSVEYDLRQKTRRREIPTPVDAIQPIYLYVKSCRDALYKKMLLSSDKIELIRKAYRAITDKSKYAKIDIIEDMINNYRMRYYFTRPNKEGLS